ncbi:hypothetical protein ACWGJB_38995 [Streptomyces sp. NPDC054813]
MSSTIRCDWNSDSKPNRIMDSSDLEVGRRAFRFTTVFDDHPQEEITWIGEDDVQQVATVPVVTFARTSPGIAWVASPKEGR